MIEEDAYSDVNFNLMINQITNIVSLSGTKEKMIDGVKTLIIKAKGHLNHSDLDSFEDKWDNYDIDLMVKSHLIYISQKENKNKEKRMKFKLIEADGGYGDLGVIPTTSSPAVKKEIKNPEHPKENKENKENKVTFKLKKDVDEARGNRDAKAKKVAKKVSKARSKVSSKCADSQSPHKVSKPGKPARFICKTKDKAKARKTSKRMKKFNKTAKGKKSGKVRQATKKFRSK